MRHPAFLQFWFARGASGFAFQMLSVAVAWQIYAMTHRAFDLGMIGLVQFIPSIALALVAGHVADRYERRHVVLICQIVEGLAVGLLAVGSFLHWFHEATILTLIFSSVSPGLSSSRRCKRCSRFWYRPCFIRAPWPPALRRCSRR